MKYTLRGLRLFGVLALLALILGTPGALHAQGGSRTFPETGQTVSGDFLDYWNNHGQLAQQGYPISAEMQEKSDLNGQTYTVQYFERAVFEKHPENAAPYNVLLSQLGTFRYKAKYGDPGAPNQTASTDNARVFPETGKTLGGKFRAYWESHGGLAQQGFPISNEFQEKSDLNGQTYTVQYFERAVFEAHPENAAPYDVLLSQLGTFQYKAKYQSPGATSTPAPGATNTPAPSGDCGDVPAARDATITPLCGPIGTQYRIHIRGFIANEDLSFWVTAPNGDVLGTARPLNVGQHPGELDDRFDSADLTSLTSNTAGIWAITYEGSASHHQSVVWFKVQAASGAPTATPSGSGGCDVSGNKDGKAEPSSVRPGDRIVFTATGFQSGEKVSFWFTTPAGLTVGTTAPQSGLVNPNGSIGPLPLTIPSSFGQLPGRWAITFAGETSQHQSVIYFCVSP